MFWVPSIDFGWQIYFISMHHLDLHSTILLTFVWHLDESSGEWINITSIPGSYHCQLAHQYKRRLTSIELDPLPSKSLHSFQLTFNKNTTQAACHNHRLYIPYNLCHNVNNHFICYPLSKNPPFSQIP